MKRKIFYGLAAVAVITVVAVACKKNVTPGFEARSTFAGPFVDTVTLPLLINGNRTLTADTLYLLSGKSYVINDAELFVEEGARIEGIKRSTADSASALIITRGSSIVAEGSPTNPIVFTSNQASPAPGDWGGIVILGRAPLNRADTTIEGIGEPSLPVGVDIEYGGNDCGDYSGTLRYVRIEYAGAVISEGNELNGLTCGAVGNGTTLSFIQVAYGADDGFEFFGGCVNADHLVSFGNNDDDLDFDFGYSGTIQFAVGSKVPDVPYSGNPNGIESDNNPGSGVNTPRTNAILSNLTLIGSDANCVNSKALLDGARFRTNSSLTLVNSIVIDYPTGLNLQSTATQPDASRFRSNFLHGVTKSDTATSPSAVLTTTVYNNKTWEGCSSGFANDTVKLVSPYAANPVYTPQSGSPVLTGADFTTITLPNTTTVAYRGAFAFNSDWTLGWTRWNF